MTLVTDLFNSSCDLRSWGGRSKGVKDGISGQGIYEYGKRTSRIPELFVCKTCVCAHARVYFFFPGEVVCSFQQTLK